MNDEDKPVNKAPKKPNSRKRGISRAAASTGRIRNAPPVSVPVVPHLPDRSPVSSRRTLALRLSVLLTTLTLVGGTIAWFTDAPMRFRGEWTQAPRNASALADSAPVDLRESLKQELRLAALALDIRQSQETMARLSEEARALATTVGSFASAMDQIKSEVGAARIDAATARARIEEGLPAVKTPVVAEPFLLVDPTLREPLSADLGAEVPTAEASESVQPATTGGLPDVSPPRSEVSVTPFNPTRAPRPTVIRGWRVHSANADLAIVVSNKGHYRVQAGQILPGAGIVRAITQHGDQWVVPKGLIREARSLGKTGR